MSFRIVGLPLAPFAPLFERDDAALAAQGACWVTATSDHGFPCRVSLRDAAAGERLLLLPYEHFAADSPYRASGPIYVRRDAQPVQLAIGEVPDYVRRRLISLRGYDAADMMIDADVVPGDDVAARIEQSFANPTVRYIHLHNAKPGCYSCRVERVED
jgi:hypothetical protein